MTDLSFEDFSNEYSSNSEKSGKLYSYLSENKMTDLNDVDFHSEYFGDLKKKEETPEPIPQELDNLAAQPVEDAYANYPTSSEKVSTSPSSELKSESSPTSKGLVLGSPEANKALEGYTPNLEEGKYASDFSPEKELEKLQIEEAETEQRHSLRDLSEKASYDPSMYIKEEEVDYQNKMVDLVGFLEKDLDWKQVNSEGMEGADDYAFSWTPKVDEGPYNNYVWLDKLSKGSGVDVSDADVRHAQSFLREKAVNNNRKEYLGILSEDLAEEAKATDQSVFDVLTDRYEEISAPYLDEDSEKIEDLNFSIQGNQLDINSKSAEIKKLLNDFSENPKVLPDPSPKIQKLELEIGKLRKLKSRLNLQRNELMPKEDQWFDANFNVVNKDKADDAATKLMADFNSELEMLLHSNDKGRLMKRVMDLHADLNFYGDKFNKMTGPDATGTTVQRSNDDAVKERNEKAAKMKNLVTFISTHQDPSKLSSSWYKEIADGFLKALPGSVGEGLVETNREKVESVYSELQKLGIDRPEDLDRLEGSLLEQVSAGVGMAAETVAEFAVESAFTEGIGAPAAYARAASKVAKAFKMGSKTRKAFMKAAAYGYEEAKFGSHGIGLGTATVENVAEKIISKSGLNKILDAKLGKFGFAVKVPLKAAAMTLTESAGDALAGELSGASVTTNYIFGIMMGAISRRGISGKLTVEEAIEAENKMLEQAKKDGVPQDEIDFIIKNSPFRGDGSDTKTEEAEPVFTESIKALESGELELSEDVIKASEDLSMAGGKVSAETSNKVQNELTEKIDELKEKGDESSIAQATELEQFKEVVANNTTDEGTSVEQTSESESETSTQQDAESPRTVESDIQYMKDKIADPDTDAYVTEMYQEDLASIEADPEKHYRDSAETSKRIADKYAKDGETAEAKRWNDQAKEEQRMADSLSESKTEQETEEVLGEAAEDQPQVEVKDTDIKDRHDSVAKKMRSYKLDVDKNLLASGISPEMIKGAINGAIEVAAKTVETVGTISQAMSNGIKELKKTELYKGLDAERKAKLEAETTKQIRQSLRHSVTSLEAVRESIPKEVMSDAKAAFEAAKSESKLNDADALSEAVKTVERSDYYKGLEPEAKADVLADVKNSLETELIPKKKSKTKDQKTVDKVVDKKPKGKKVLVDSWKEFKRSMKQREKAFKAGKKAKALSIKGVKNKLSEFLTANAKEIRAAGITTRKTLLEKVNKLTEKNLDSTIAYIEDQINRSMRATEIKGARTSQKAAKKASKGKPKNVKALGEAIADIDPRFVKNPSEVSELANDYKDSVGVKGGDTASIVDRLEALKKQEKEGIKEAKDAKAREAYDKSNLKDEMSFSDFKDLIYDADSVIENEKLGEEEKGKSKNRVRLEKVVRERMNSLLEKLNSSNDLSKDQKNTMKVLSDPSLDIENMPTSELKTLGNVITEIEVFDSYNRSGEIETIITGREVAKGIRSFFEGRVELPGMVTGAPKSLINLPNFFKFIAGGAGGKRLRRMLLAPLDRSNQIAQKLSDRFNSKLDDLYRGLKNRQESFVKMGMVSFVAQHESDMTAAEIEQDFIAKKNLIILQIKKLKELSKSKTATPDKRRSFKRLAKEQEEVYNKFFKDAKSKEDFVNTLNPVEAKIYNMVKESFSETKEPLKDSHNKFNGKEFIEFDEYVPTSVRPVDKYNDIEIANGGFDSPVPSIDSRQSGSTIKRQKLQTKDADGNAKTGEDLNNVDLKSVQIFDMNLVAKQKMKEVLYDIHTLKDRKVLDSAMKSKDMKSTLGQDLHKEMVNKLSAKIASQKGTFIDGLRDAHWALKSFIGSSRYIKMTVLRTWDQWLKQPASIIAHSYGTIGSRATTNSFKVMLDIYTNKEASDAFNKLIATSEITNRVTDGEWIIKEGESIVKSLIKAGKLDKTIGAKVYETVFDDALIKGDDFATRLSWLAAYMKELKKSGKISKYSDFNLIEAANNVDNDAISNADSMSQDINNASDFSDAPDMFRKGDKTYLREAFYNFKSFSINMTMRNIVAVRDLVNSNGREVDKVAAVRQLVGSALATLTFQAMKEFVVNEIYDEALEYIFDLDDEDYDLEGKLSKTASKSIADYLVGGMPGGETTEELFKHAINFLNQVYIEKVKKEKYNKRKDNIYFTGTGGAKSVLPGSLEMPLDVAISSYEIGGELIGEGELKKDEQMRAYALISTLLGEGSTDRFFSKAYYKLRKEEDEKGGRSTSTRETSERSVSSR
jgi:hypothetical protein